MQGSSASASTAPDGPALDEPRTLGKYELLRLIARGGMGEVHLARLPGELGFEKRLVIKTIRAELATDPRFVELFAAEARTAVALSHPNIAPIYELGRAADGTLFTAMGWVDGPSLDEVIRRLRAGERTLELGAALFITRELLDGLAHAHSHDRARPPVVHRDITPRNVLVDRSGRVQIIDFGIAKPVEAEVGGAMGSAGYMAPEQARGELVDPRADVFGVGCVLYELLTSKRAFDGDGVWMLPSFERVPEPIRDTLARALALDPDDRFVDAEAFLRALAPILAEQAPAFGTRDLAAIVASLFDDGEEPAGHEHGEERTPATRIGAVETFATRPIAAADPVEGRAVIEPTGDVRRIPVWPIAIMLLTLGLIWLQPWRGDPTTASRDMPKPTPPAPSDREPPPIPPPIEIDDDASTPTLVTLELRPADATVIVDGVVVPGPPHVLELHDARVELRVEHAEYRPQIRSLDPRTIVAGPLTIELEPLPHTEEPEPEPTRRREGSLTVLAPSLAWAEVWLDGSKVGTTPMTDKLVLEGKHKLEVRCVAAVCGNDRNLLTQTIRIRPGQPLSFEVGE